MGKRERPPLKFRVLTNDGQYFTHLRDIATSETATWRNLSSVESSYQSMVPQGLGSGRTHCNRGAGVTDRSRDIVGGPPVGLI
jgi:hypothetical protein